MKYGQMTDVQKKKVLRVLIYIWLGLLVVLVYATMYARQNKLSNEVVVPALNHDR